MRWHAKAHLFLVFVTPFAPWMLVRWRHLVCCKCQKNPIFYCIEKLQWVSPTFSHIWQSTSVCSPCPSKPTQTGAHDPHLTMQFEANIDTKFRNMPHLPTAVLWIHNEIPICSYTMSTNINLSIAPSSYDALRANVLMKLVELTPHVWLSPLHFHIITTNTINPTWRDVETW